MPSLNQRRSNIELLRILAMLMIIAFHIYYYAVSFQLTDEASIEAMGNGFFCDPQFDRRLLVLAFLAPLGKCGNAIFLLISGYFLVEKGSRVNLRKSAEKLLLQLAFAVLFLMLASFWLYRYTKGSGLWADLYTVDSSMFNKSFWFVGYYLAVIVIGALFLNRFLLKLSRRSYLTVLIVVFALVEFAWTGEMLESLATGLRILVTGIFLYALGGFLARYQPLHRVRGWALLLVILCCFALVFLSAYNVTIRNIQDFLADEDAEQFYQQLPVFKDYSLLPILMAVSLFELFSRLSMPCSSVINYLASSSLMVYLFHDNNFIREIWKLRDWIGLLYEHPGWYCVVHFGWTAVTFLCGLVLYSVFVLLCRLLPRCSRLILKKEPEPNPEKSDTDDSLD